jgi:hypothetical protein
MRRYFPRNRDQVLDFFARLLDRRLREGRRPLLVAKKAFVPACAAGIEDRLRRLGHREARVVTGGWDGVDLASPLVIPLINYGTVGVNRFQERDGAYCLTGYYVNDAVLNEVVQDLVGSDGHVPIRIWTEGSPRRRRAGARRPADRRYDVDRLAQLALDRQELDVVLQAIGRVRPYTRPREVVSFQLHAHPFLEYTREFHSLADARAYFDLPARRDRAAQDRTAQVQALRAAGKTQRQVAADLGIGLATVKRHWNRPPGH